MGEPFSVNSAKVISSKKCLSFVLDEMKVLSFVFIASRVQANWFYCSTIIRVLLLVGLQPVYCKLPYSALTQKRHRMGPRQRFGGRSCLYSLCISLAVVA